MVKHEPEYCDHCADQLDPAARYVVEELPVNVSNANEGESATLCRVCYEAVKECDWKVMLAYMELMRVAVRNGPGTGQGE